MELDARIDEVQNLAAMGAGCGTHPKHHLMRYHDFFVERIRKGERVLDLGCGYAAVAASIAERAGAGVTGMDWSESNLAQARAMAFEPLAEQVVLGHHAGDAAGAADVTGGGSGRPVTSPSRDPS